jgi:hypothetical protein
MLFSDGERVLFAVIRVTRRTLAHRENWIKGAGQARTQRLRLPAAELATFLEGRRPAYGVPAGEAAQNGRPA